MWTEGLFHLRIMPEVICSNVEGAGGSIPHWNMQPI